ncbi:T9SS type A sorting domain-containing protein [Chryseobacterium sp. SIMBA_038]|uniref:T9SS type A sorting domain-containing protein n=1 Tax=Chryseobacterium sp. SIMBA_038 TaxID=3085780 RepID=UPI00397A0E3E
MSVNVYPNPTKGDVNINADSKINSIEIYDAQGRIIQKQMGINSQNTKVSIHSNSSGMYILKIITEKETFTKKIIKN